MTSAYEGERPATATSYTDADRRRITTRNGALEMGPIEADRCPHGALYFFRWVWVEGGDVLEGAPMHIPGGCQDCKPDVEDVA